MHILIGFLGTLATLLFVLHRLADAGMSLGGLNPFWWRRRRAWRRKYEANPLFSLEDPKDIAAVLVVGVTKIDGDMSVEEKRALPSEFERTFGIDSREAGELVASSAYLLGDADALRSQLDAVLANCRERFTRQQAGSVVEMMERIASLGGSPTAAQLRLIEGVRDALIGRDEPQGTWG